MASAKELRQMIERQGFKCAGSGIDLEPEHASLDHKKARSRGGGSGLDNLHIIHDVLNRAKGDLDWEDFVAMCHAVARIHDDPGSDWWNHRVKQREARSMAPSGGM